MDKKHSGTIGVTTQDIFPVIKKFLYSDHEIFLRELVSNAVDATQKIKALARTGEFKGELGDLKVRVSFDEKNHTITISDHGIGMSEAEVKKYINQIAFSSAGEFLDKYKDQAEGLIGHFGLGFYSSFMVSEKVEIVTRSWREEEPAVRWSCKGDPKFTMEPDERSERGTDIILHLDDEFKLYADKYKLGALLDKYCKFLPVEVVFGKKTEWKDGKQVELEEDNVINDVNPLWVRKPAELKDEDYLEFYHKLLPGADDPLFWIHLNVDYPFNLTGVLYFPKISNKLEAMKNKIQLYCNQVFVTDNVENIVPEFMTLLHGVIDSPDIPLNVSRSYLQSDPNVKKISAHITKKVADRLEEIFRNDRAQAEEKWDNIKLFIEYGMLTDVKFCERALKFALLKNTDGKFFAIEDYTKAIEGEQKNKDKQTVYLYATDVNSQYSYINAAKDRGYDVLLFDSPLSAHFVSMLESKLEGSRFSRVDADTPDRLIEKETSTEPEISDDEKKELQGLFADKLPKDAEFEVKFANMGAAGLPVMLIQSEFMRRYRDMAQVSGGMNYMGTMPESYQMVVNCEHPLTERIRQTKDADLISQVCDLALLANGLLKGEALDRFIKRSVNLI